MSIIDFLFGLSSLLIYALSIVRLFTKEFFPFTKGMEGKVPVKS